MFRPFSEIEANQPKSSLKKTQSTPLTKGGITVFLNRI